jgi:hypothetical protein
MAQSQSPRRRKSGRTTADTRGLRATPGPRVTYRVRGHGQFKPIEKFIASAKAHLQERYEHYTRLCNNTTDTAWEKRWYERMCEDITDTLYSLASPRIGLKALSEIVHKVYGGTSDYPLDMERSAKGMRLFVDIEFRQEPVPRVEPLVQLPPSTVFCHVTGIGGPFLMKQIPPVPRSDERTREAILAEHKNRQAERLTRPNAPEREQPSPAPETHPTTRQGAEPTQEKVIPMFPKRPRLGGGAKPIA